MITRTLKLTQLSAALALAFGAHAAERAPIAHPPATYAAQWQTQTPRWTPHFPAPVFTGTAPRPSGGSIAVTSCLDDGSSGTLRSVIGNAPSGTVIDMSALGCSVITLTQGELNFSQHDLQFIGPAAAVPGGAPTLTIDADYRGRAFHATSDTGGVTQLQNLRVVNGAVHGHDGFEGGGCVMAQDRLYITDSVFDNCAVSDTYAIGGAIAAGSLILGRSTVTGSRAVASTPSGSNSSGRVAFAGGVYAYGAMAVFDSTISGNEARLGVNGNNASDAYTSGGGIGMSPFYAQHNAPQSVFIAGSTISNNQSERQAGGIEAHGTIVIANTTISGNTAGFVGGLEAHDAELKLENSTIAFNSAYSVGGVYAPADIPMALDSTIIANNITTDTSLAKDLAQRFAVTVNGANNLVMTSDPAVTFAFAPLTADPKLLPLADNGGLTLTHALASNSPAIGTGSNAAGLDYDQRGVGFPRSIGGLTDIGAVERGDRIFAGRFE
jgi:hypothetical protein